MRYATKSGAFRPKFFAKPLFYCAAIVALLVVVATTIVYRQHAVHAASNISGTVYADFNANGVQDNVNGATSGLAVDNGVSGVTVKAFGVNSALCDTQTTAANGTYTLAMAACAGTNFRIEFSNLPAGYKSSQIGSGSNSTTQFVTAGGTASLGINTPSDFCQNNPTLCTSIMSQGRSAGATANNKALLGNRYGDTGTAANTLTLGTNQQIGSVYGLAYRKSSKTIFSSAYMKRHADFGTGSLGTIYKSVVPAGATGTATPSIYATIPNVGTDLHPISDTDCSPRDGSATVPNEPSGDCWKRDYFSFDSVGKSGLGDLAFYESPTSASNDALFTVNLNNRSLYKITNLDGAASVSSAITLPLGLPGAAQGCTNSDVRPFALAFKQGVGYLGMTCSAATSGNTSNLRAYIYSFNPTTNVFASAPTLEIPLNYARGCLDTCSYPGEFHPWIDSFTVPPVQYGSIYDDTYYPQPLLSDIAFGANNSMTIGIRDRFGDQTGNAANSDQPGDNNLYDGGVAGDVLRACLIGSTWTLENAGTCNGAGPGAAGVNSANPSHGQGPGGYEFYPNDRITSHEENSQGSLVNIPGFNEVSTSANLTQDFSTGNFIPVAGSNKFNVSTGATNSSQELYRDTAGTSGTFGKANGLGAQEVLCDSAPIEVGNRVWKDSNNNGVQDPGEASIAGVTVHLYNAANALIGTTTTDSNGSYLFSNRTIAADGTTLSDATGVDYGVAGLTANTNNFTIKLDNSTDYAATNRLQNLSVSPKNVTTNSGNVQNDSDAATPTTAAPSAANAPFVTFNTANSGDNVHTYDFGFSPQLSIGNFIWFDANKDGIVNGSDATSGFNGITVNLYAGAADTSNDGTLSAAEMGAASPLATTTTANDARAGATNGRPGYYSFSGLVPGKYFVAVAGSNFSGALATYTASPVPSGVADTQDDNKSHGAIPAGGSLVANGVVSTAIDLQDGTEPTNATAKADDDTNANSDNTIDFGFWHGYSLGNRVWLDSDNSATINGADGGTPGVAGVTVNLLDGATNAVISTTTSDASGYYRFDTLNAGNYKIEIAGSNFGAGQPLETLKLSSIAAAESNNPNDNVDNNDDGINPSTPGTAVRSGTITLGPNASEPTGETDVAAAGQGTDDAFANMTLDFGFVPSSSFGDTVYFDQNGNVTQDSNEPGINGVTVTLKSPGADTTPCTGDDVTVGSAVTNSQGKYLFSNVTPGTYCATVDTSTVSGGVATTATQMSGAVTASAPYLAADFGFRNDGTIGNQIFRDYNNDGVYNAANGDNGLANVTLDLYDDANGNCAVDIGDTRIATTTSNGSGQYQFSNLLTDDNRAGNGAGAKYLVKVTDTNSVLGNYTHSTGAAGIDNNSQDQTGYCATLTNAQHGNQTADFGYSPNPNLVDPPSFKKTYSLSGATLSWRMVWINQSAVNNVLAHIEDVIPVGTAYVSSSLQCQAQGSSTTTNCAYDTLTKKLTWDGTVGADAGHATEAAAANEIVITFQTTLANDTTDVANQATSTWDQNNDSAINAFDANVTNTTLGQSDDPTTAPSQDPTRFHRDLSVAGGVTNSVTTTLAKTGQNIWLMIAGAIVTMGLALTIIIRSRKATR